VNAEAVSTILVLADVLIHCEVATRGKRVIDQLNDRESNYVAGTNARIFRHPTEGPTLVPGDIVIVKDQIHMAMPVEAKVGSDKLFFATIERQHFKVVLTTSNAVLRGNIQAKIAKDPRSFLTVDAGPFFAVTGTTVSHPFLEERLETPVVIVGKTHVSSLAFQS